jgi:hypothetical protein
MTAEDFRRIALGMPEALESAHMDHPDFRVNNKIFATLFWPDEGWGMVKLTPEQQHDLVTSKPAAFMPVKGGWGKRGATQVRLDRVDAGALRSAILTAWRNTAPKRLIDGRGPSSSK